MDREDRVRAAYQHRALKWVMRDHMTNLSLRARFGLPENKSVNESQAIAYAVDARIIKLDEVGGYVAQVCPVYTILGVRFSFKRLP